MRECNLLHKGVSLSQRAFSSDLNTTQAKKLLLPPLLYQIHQGYIQYRIWVTQFQFWSEKVQANESV